MFQHVAFANKEWNEKYKTEDCFHKYKTQLIVAKMGNGVEVGTSNNIETSLCGAC
jgi:hypothetical protein